MSDLFGEIENKTSRILAFHDESGVFGCDRWVLMGILWVDDRYRQKIFDYLKQIRAEHEYWGEIHFNEFPSNFSGCHSKDVRVARDWLETYFSAASMYTWFNVFAVDTHHPNYQHKRFTKKFHAYNRFCRIAFHSGLAYHFRNFSSLELKIHSDKKIERPGGLLGDGLTSDNFEQYLAGGLLQDSLSNPKIPPVRLCGPVECLSIPSMREKDQIKPEEEFLQLCDVLTGSVASAIITRSMQQTKFWFGQKITPLILDTRKPSRQQVYGLHRRFSVSYFPNKEGKIYNNGPLRILDFLGQKSLFG